MIEGMIISPLELIGKFSVESGLAVIGDPSNFDDWESNDKWKETISGQTDLSGKDGKSSFDGAYATSFDSEMWADPLYLKDGSPAAIVFRTFRDGLFSVYAKFNEEGRVVKVVIDLEPGESDLSSGLAVEPSFIGGIGINSGQAMVGDPCHLDKWISSEGQDWDLTGKIGEYSYQGASATTIDNVAGELEGNRAVVFNTGYGDGEYGVYAEVDEDTDGQILKIIIDFASDE
jgi:hypothetical protein